MDAFHYILIDSIIFLCQCKGETLYKSRFSPIFEPIFFPSRIIPCLFCLFLGKTAINWVFRVLPSPIPCLFRTGALTSMAEAEECKLLRVSFLALLAGQTAAPAGTNHSACLRETRLKPAESILTTTNDFLWKFERKTLNSCSGCDM